MVNLTLDVFSELSFQHIPMCDANHLVFTDHVPSILSSKMCLDKPRQMIGDRVHFKERNLRVIPTMTFYLTYTLTFYLAFYLRSVLSFSLTFYQAFYLTFYLTCRTRNWGPAVPTVTEIWLSQLEAAVPTKIRPSRLRSGSPADIWPS